MKDSFVTSVKVGLAKESALQGRVMRVRPVLWA